MKKTTLTGFVFLAFIINGYSQGPTRPMGNHEQKTPRRPSATVEERAKAKTEWLEKQLLLSADQKTKIYGIYLTAEKTNSERTQNLKKTSTIGTGMAEAKASLEITEKSIAAVLNENQKMLFNQLKVERAQKLKVSEPRTKISAEKRALLSTEALDKKLALAADQKFKIYQLNLERAQAINKLEAKKGTSQITDPLERDRINQLIENKILAILNSDQKTTYKKMKLDRKNALQRQKGSRKPPIQSKR